MDKETEDKLKQLGSMFGITEIPDNLGEVLESFLSGKSDEANVESDTEEKKVTDLRIDIDPETIRLITTLKKSLDRNKSDDKARLLKALTPFLNEKKQQKVNNALRLITFAEIAKNKDLLGL